VAREVDPDAATRSLQATWPEAPQELVTDEPLTGVGPGDRVGRYVVRSCIDRGGMGIVYEARDEALGRSVALKLLLPGSERAPRVAARLVQEARAAARVSHPNVVVVYDVGVHEGTVFLAMERVHGVTLREWLEETPRSWREVVAMFIPAGRGVAAAHAAGIVHRDLKAENILCGVDRVRVADFGLASTADATIRGLSPPIETDARLTLAGSIVGTPRYMAPEQRTGSDADARSDQYSFCVSLHEALGGAMPYVEGPAGTPAAPRWLRRVIERGLRPDPAARHPSMDALLSELQRDRRSRWTGGVAGAVLLGLLALLALPRLRAGSPCESAARELAGIWDDPVRAQLTAHLGGLDASHVPAMWREVRVALDAYADAWVDGHAQACSATRVHGDQSEEMLDRRLACLDSRRQSLASLTAALGRVELAGIEAAARAARELPPVADCADRARLARAAAPGRHPQAARAREDLAAAHLQRLLGSATEARVLAARALAQLRRARDLEGEAEALLVLGQAEHDDRDLVAAVVSLTHAADAAQRVGAARLRARAFGHLAQAYQGLGRLDEASQVLELAFAAARELGDRSLEAGLLHARGTLLGRRGQERDARQHVERSLAILAELHGPDADVLRPGHDVLAAILRKSGELEGALIHAERALAIARSRGDEHPRTAEARQNLADVLQAMGRRAEAGAELERATQVLRAAYGERHEEVAVALTAQGSWLASIGDEREAIARLREALAIRAALGQGDRDDLLTTRTTLASLLVAAGAPVEAVLILREVVVRRERLLGPSHADVAHAVRMLAAAELARGDADEAWRSFERALAIYRAAHGETHPGVAETLQGMAAVERRRARPQEALRLDEAAVELLGGVLPAEHPDHARARLSLAQDHLRLGHRGRALELAEGALAVAERSGNLVHRGEARWILARARLASGRACEGALELARRARDDLEAAGRVGARDEIDRWLIARAGRAASRCGPAGRLRHPSF
jgi:eukaryotic-like serine/threonine-protein kinase